jgi:hypothetical protein
VTRGNVVNSTPVDRSRSSSNVADLQLRVARLADGAADSARQGDGRRHGSGSRCVLGEVALEVGQVTLGSV